MHPFVAIPLLVCVGAAVLASAVVARDPGSRGNRLAGAALACAGLWSFIDALIDTAPDAASALFWARTLGFGYLFLAPLCLDLLCELRPGLRAGLRRWLTFGYASSVLLALAHWLTPWFIAAVFPAPWGWSYRVGPIFPIAYLHAAGYASFSAIALLRSGRERPGESRAPAVVLAAAVLVPVATATLTDVVLPLFGNLAPRVGALSVTLLCGSTWLLAMRNESLSVTASAFARQILDTLPDGVAILEHDGCIRSLNASLARMLGRSDGSLPGRAIGDLLAEPIARGLASFDDRETWLRLDSGELLPVSLSTTVLRDRQGYPIGSLLMVRDHREVVALRRRLVTSARLAAVGELSAGIAHEVNNPVAYIHANLNLLARHASALRKREGRGRADAVEVSDGVRRCLDDVERVASIVRVVRGLSRADGDERRTVDLAELIEGVVRLAAHRLRHGQVELDLPSLPLVECSEQQFKQVFLDLLLNAARVTPPGGRIRVRGGRDGDHVCIRVEDEGPPIADEDLVGMFDPRATDRTVREGRGLGLSISYQILRQHGGRIEVDTNGGSGTRVTLRCPAAPGVEAAP